MTMAPAGRELAQAARHQRHGAIVEAGERFVEQEQPRLVQQRALERQTLPHASRERRHVVVGAVREAGRFERRRNDLRGIEAVQPGEKKSRFWRAVSSG